MSVKVRKVGNSFTVTIPSGFVEYLNLYDGQELEVNSTGHSLEYKPIVKVPDTIHWEKYEALSGSFTDGIDPDDYVRSLRDNDRE